MRDWIRHGAISAALLGGFSMPARAADPAPIANFGFDLLNTSPADSTPAELDRTRRLGDQLAAALQQSGDYKVIDTSSAKAELAKLPDVRQCNGCELPIAKRVGATMAVYGWVQKVSNLILNINLVIETVSDGKQVLGGSVDIRGNTDEDWSRGLKFLLEEHVFNKR